MLSTRESILEGDAPRPTVPVDAGACHIGSGARTMKKRVEVPRPPLPASAAEPQARVAMIDGEGAFDLDALPELLTRGGGRVEKVKPKKFSSGRAGGRRLRKMGLEIKFSGLKIRLESPLRALD